LKKLLALGLCAAALLSCSTPGSGYLSGIHYAYYTVVVASGAFGTASGTVQTAPSGGSVPFSGASLPYTSSTISMSFTGAGAVLTGTASATSSVGAGPAALTMGIWIDGIQKYSATTTPAAAAGAAASVTVQTPLI